MTWSVFHASVRGTSHAELGLPCQDACEVWASDDLLIVAVSDGAGSGSRSELGSALCVHSVVSTLRAYLELPHGFIDRGLDALMESRSHLVDVVERARREIAELANSHHLELRDLACTLVGVVAHLPDRGYFFHIGDGAAVANVVGSSTRAVVSAPENGEYSNETWFITAEDWRVHLRIMPIEYPIELIAVMTDGAVPFAMAPKASGLFRGFIEPVTNYLKERQYEEGNIGLHSVLESDRTASITNDDKTLVLAFPKK
ncbi:MAG: PP2C family serine/threonine-protein phosphatase [Ktedonobacteraceae bacterium]